MIYADGTDPGDDTPESFKYPLLVQQLADEMACSDLMRDAVDDTPTRHALAVLASPEMREVKALIRWYAHTITDKTWLTDPAGALRAATSLHPSTVEWVMSE